MPAEAPVATPLTLAEAYDLLAGGDGWQPVAGGTDLMVQIAGELVDPPERVLDLWRLDELRGIHLGARGLVLGALTTYTDIRRSPLCAEVLPALVEAAATIGAAQIQNRGTIGGNVINASPAGDTLPILLATDAELVLGGARGERTVAARDFWPAYRRTARRGGGAARPLPLAPTPIRAARTERVLEGAAPRQTTADHAASVLAAEIHPIDDVRSTADYRRVVSARILHRLL